MARAPIEGPSPLEYHLLLALAGGPLHGYALAEAIAAESRGAIAPRAGSLYRVLARLVAAGLVVETATDAEPHPGLPRRAYALTAAGRRAFAAETRRLEQTVAVARQRLTPARGRP
jgi:DNA-binding PadR family transcriptional regulator